MAAQEHWLGRWAMDSMLINVSTRPFGRAIRLPEDEVQPSAGLGFSKSAASRRLQRSGHARRGSRRQLPNRASIPIRRGRSSAFARELQSTVIRVRA